MHPWHSRRLPPGRRRRLLLHNLRVRYRRTPRRQGVVYGPVLGPGQQPPNQSSAIGRLLGAAVIVGALVLIGAATFMFLGRVQPGPATSPAPTGVAVASPTALAPTSGPASPTPAAPATPQLTLPPTPEPSPEPTPLEVEVREGAGFVTFGSSWNRGLQMQGVSATFTPGGRIAWSAVLSEPAGAPTLDVTVSRVDPAEATEEITWEEEYAVQNQGSERVLRRVPINRVTDGPGIYVVRYARGGEVLSEGYFELAESD